jgi:4-hydroxyproline epimerase
MDVYNVVDLAGKNTFLFMPELKRIRVIDSHTAGEPTRLVIEGGPDLGDGPLSKRLERFRAEHDSFRSAVVNEPRGSDVVVGGLLCGPSDPRCAAGIIFFNNVGYLGMCGHGTIGAIATLHYLSRITLGELWIDTPVGAVRATLHSSGKVTVANVESFRTVHQVEVEVPGYGKVAGDVAWGGNWFFLVENHGQVLRLDRTDALTEFTWAIRKALAASGIRGSDGHEIDHIELFATPENGTAHSRNFVLCPGKAYDRSPCGTGTSAKLACLYADGKLAPGQMWRQEGILGSVFEGEVEVRDGKVYPSITGSAHITAESTLILDPEDPFAFGFRS